jgi:hypothetical protein
MEAWHNPLIRPEIDSGCAIVPQEGHGLFSSAIGIRKDRAMSLFGIVCNGQ